MKKILRALLLCLLLIPFNVFAASNKYESMNLEETFAEEAEITKESESVFKYDLSNYAETDDQITIYLFRGRGCAYCNRFLVFLNNIVGEYGKYFKLESYEVWYNSDNSELFDEVAEFLDEDAGGVPFIVIGDKVFPGYASQYDESIKQAIVNLYNSSDRYDVFEEMEKAERLAKITAIIPYVVNAGAIVAATIVIVAYMHSNTKKINEKFSIIEQELKEIKKVQIEKIEKNQVNAVKSKKTVKNVKENKTTKNTKKKTDEK